MGSGEKGTTIGSGCPYAAPIVSKNEDDHTSVSSSSETRTHAQALELARTSCPAFANNSCPFKEDIGKAIATMPPSHVSFPSETRNSVKLALEHVHHVARRSSSFDSPKYALPIERLKELESLSLSAIIGRLVEQEGHEPDSMDPAINSESIATGKIVHKSAVTVASTPVLESHPHTEESPGPIVLSKALKSGTEESHAAAESVHFVKNFIKGKIDRDLFARLTLNLYFVYQTLEKLLDTHAHLHFPSLHFPKELNREEVLEDDVEFYHGYNWKSTQHPSPAAKDYMERMEYIAKTEPLLLLSHAYTRYLGDLSGGRVLARVARKALNLGGKGDNDGLRFYYFDNISNPKQFKDDYRSRLDQLRGIDLAQAERLVAEANVAFVLNMRMFEELDMLSGDVPTASVRDLKEATKYYDICIQEQQKSSTGHGRRFSDQLKNNADAGKCPFANLPGTKNHTHDHNTIQNHSLEPKKKGERCPWPFVFMHDPKTGMKDYQTWVVIGIVFSWLWSKIV